MAQMRDICLSVEQVYNPGVRIILLTDGLVYAGMFDKSETDKLIAYREASRNIRNELGIQEKVSLLDMAWVTDRDPNLTHAQGYIKHMLLLLEQSNDVVQQSLRSLRHGMLYNVDSQGYQFDGYASFLSLPEEQLPDDLHERISSAAINYASFLLAMQQRSVLPRAFPNAIRGTVHPKDAPQLPLHLVDRNSVTFPYNGVPVVSKSRLTLRGNIRRATRIMRFYDLLHYPEAKAIHQGGDNTPFYYEIA